MIVVHAFLYAKPETREAFKQGLAELQASTLAEDAGCLHYTFYQDIGDADRFVCVEQWQDMDSLEAHLAADHHARAGERLDALRARPAEVRVFTAEPVEP
ncbi:putative quinol monooxygenase [Glycomyces tarimensis]